MEPNRFTRIPRVRVIVALLATLAVPSLFAETLTGRVFNNESLKGRYGFHALAWAINFDEQNNPSSYSPFAFSGYWEFDGNGNFTAKDTLVDPPTVLTDRVYGGTYQVNPDGTGVFTIDLPGASFSSGFTIVEDGQTIEVLHRRSDVVATFSLRKQGNNQRR